MASDVRSIVIESTLRDFTPLKSNVCLLNDIVWDTFKLSVGYYFPYAGCSRKQFKTACTINNLVANGIGNPSTLSYVRVLRSSLGRG